MGGVWGVCVLLLFIYIFFNFYFLNLLVLF